MKSLPLLIMAATFTFPVPAAEPGDAAREKAPAVFPEHVDIRQRFDCTVRSTGGKKRRFEPYPVGDYTVLFPAGDTGLVWGKPVPYIHTLADGRTYFERGIIERVPADLGASFGFALRTSPGAILAFTPLYAWNDKSRLRGSYRMDDGSSVELEGECRVRTGPIPVYMPSP